MKVTVEQVSLAARDAFATGRAAHRPDVATIQALRARLQIARLRVEVLHHLLAAAEAALASVDLRYEATPSTHPLIGLSPSSQTGNLEWRRSRRSMSRWKESDEPDYEDHDLADVPWGPVCRLGAG
ncbi:MAG: hypothetical protein DMF89_17970 [Acidobacteria bacterium]|nr:MAG: hypothetical protein DMF89_17970 [Acidobacteriota bacterium]